MRTLNTHRRRRGFTLVELMIVIAIIAILLSLITVVFAGALVVARKKATEATILKVHGLMQQRIEAFHRALDRTNLQPAILKLKKDLGVTSPLNAKAYEILTRKQLFQLRFPQNFYERDISTTATSYVSSAHRQETESAALLYWLLTKSEVYGVAPVDQSEFNSGEVRDTDGDGLLEFVDGWGHPLRFYRWPTHLFRPGNGTSVAAGVSSASPITLSAIDRTYANAIWSGLPAPPQIGAPASQDPLARDPDDPTGALSRLVTTSPAFMAIFENRFHTLDTYHDFLIMSAGPDNVLGFAEPHDYGTGTSSTPPGAPDGYSTTTNSFPLISTMPALATITPAQGRLATLTNYTNVQDSPITDNVTNRKRQ